MQHFRLRNVRGNRKPSSILAKLTMWILALSLFHVPVGLAQTPPRAVEVASIKPSVFPSAGVFQGLTLNGICSIGARPLVIQGNRMKFAKMSLCQLISLAYDVPDYRLSVGPAWMLKVEQPNYYDIEVKAEGDEALTEEQGRAVLKAVLGDRFRLKVHTGSKTLPVYELTISKKGSKLTEVAADDTRRSGVSMRTYVAFISGYVDRPVVDATGLTGLHYRFQFNQTELRRQLAEGGKPVPSIFSEVEEQLGLKLSAVNGLVETLVIDSAEQPAAN